MPLSQPTVRRHLESRAQVFGLHLLDDRAPLYWEGCALGDQPSSMSSMLGGSLLILTPTHEDKMFLSQFTDEETEAWRPSTCPVTLDTE